VEYLIGLILSAAVAGFATAIGLDRERAFSRALLVEIIVAAGFLVFAVLGFKRSLWFAVAAIVGHGVFDFVHHWFIENPGVPFWWPGFCLTFDVIGWRCA
jgi:hypothetical protein